MVPDSIQRLLILQDRDARFRGIERQLADIPAEVDSFKKKIVSEEARLKEKREQKQALERRRKSLEGEVEDAEEQIRKYRTQQMQVKKNEEYKAFEHEIATTQAKISTLEDEELQVLEEIDVLQAELENLEREVTEAIDALKGNIHTLEENRSGFQSELEDARAAREKARTEAPEDALRMYDFVSNQVRRPPWVVELLDGKCSGCHLRVSGEVESAARRQTDLVRCDSCGRLVYFDR